jgi:hypothetical protein
MQVSPGFTVSECGYLSLATCTLLRRTSWCVYPDARTLRPLLPLVPASRGTDAIFSGMALWLYAIHTPAASSRWMWASSLAWRCGSTLYIRRQRRADGCGRGSALIDPKPRLTLSYGSHFSPQVAMLRSRAQALSQRGRVEGSTLGLATPCAPLPTDPLWNRRLVSFTCFFENSPMCQLWRRRPPFLLGCPRITCLEQMA